MSRQITQPLNQVRLTNVAVVRMNKNGKRFEVACYRNKIVNYRQGIEIDLSEVLQTDRVFTNVSKGEFAKSSDLKKAFGTTNEEEICRLILQKGQIQVSDQERSAFLENTLREVAVMISEKCVNPLSGRPYTLTQIRNAMKEAEFNVHPTKNVKQQFLECMKLLSAKNVIPIARAKMQLCAIVSVEDEASVRKVLMEAGVESFLLASTTTTNTKHDYLKTDAKDEAKLEFVIDPSLYRKVDEIVKSSTRGRLEIIKQAVFEEGDFDLDSEIARKEKMAAANQLEMTRETDAIVSTNDFSETAIDHDVALVTSSSQALRLEDDINQVDEKSDTTEDEDNLFPCLSSNEDVQQSQKRAQKKSKKAKRREKEAAQDREKRVEAERLRQEERKNRLGQDGTNTKLNDILARSNGGKMNGTNSCNTCGGNYSDADFRAHFKSDFHRYNLKLKLRGAPCISEGE